MISEVVYNNKQHSSESYLRNSNQEAMDEINITNRGIIKKTNMKYDEYGRRHLKGVDNKKNEIDYKSYYF